MKNIKSICVYCGSRPGKNEAFTRLAHDFGQILANHNIRLVYGGGDVGLMGTIAHSVMDHGGEVLGIIPEHLDDAEVGLREVTDFRVVANMHERKKMMFDNSDAFIALPGSIGTVDETIEVITWKQLKLHDKPSIILNIDGYWDPLLTLIDHFIEQEFTVDATKKLYHIVDKAEDILPLLSQLPAPSHAPQDELF